jgi:hypothetical protein
MRLIAPNGHQHQYDQIQNKLRTSVLSNVVGRSMELLGRGGEQRQQQQRVKKNKTDATRVGIELGSKFGRSGRRGQSNQSTATGGAYGSSPILKSRYIKERFFPRRTETETEKRDRGFVESWYFFSVLSSTLSTRSWARIGFAWRTEWQTRPQSVGSWWTNIPIRAFGMPRRERPVGESRTHGPVASPQERRRNRSHPD